MVEAKLWRESPVGAGGGGAVAEAELTEAAEAALAAKQRHWRRWSWRDEALARRKPRMRAIHPIHPRAILEHGLGTLQTQRAANSTRLKPLHFAPFSRSSPSEGKPASQLVTFLLNRRS